MLDRGRCEVVVERGGCSRDWKWMSEGPMCLGRYWVSGSDPEDTVCWGDNNNYITCISYLFISWVSVPLFKNRFNFRLFNSIRFQNSNTYSYSSFWTHINNHTSYWVMLILVSCCSMKSKLNKNENFTFKI